MYSVFDSPEGRRRVIYDRISRARVLTHAHSLTHSLTHILRITFSPFKVCVHRWVEGVDGVRGCDYKLRTTRSVQPPTGYIASGSSSLSSSLSDSRIIIVIII